VFLDLYTQDSEIGNEIAIPIEGLTSISFRETGLFDGQQLTGCISPPCGISIAVEDQLGNVVAYILQREPTASPQEIGGVYKEFFLDSPDGFYERNLFEDFSQIPGFVANGATVSVISLEIDELGTAVFDDLVIRLPEPPALLTLPAGLALLLALQRARARKRKRLTASLRMQPLQETKPGVLR
jgi:hypothetical protein